MGNFHQIKMIETDTICTHFLTLAGIYISVCFSCQRLQKYLLDKRTYLCDLSIMLIFQCYFISNGVAKKTERKTVSRTSYTTCTSVLGKCGITSIYYIMRDGKHLSCNIHAIQKHFFYQISSQQDWHVDR